jgi:hydroxymethylglutaryl-CoA lyase
VGFHTIDFGSFVSPKAIPQMADTKEVIQNLQLENNTTRLLAIVANIRGAADAMLYESITDIGFPFSISPTFQQRNANATIEESLINIDAIQSLCLQHNKQLVVYLSMGFGNPYGDVYNESILLHYADAMVQRGVQIISLSDTVGIATPQQIEFTLKILIPKYPTVTFGVHLHSKITDQNIKLQAAVNAGCCRLDGALKGIGGCPMAQDDLVGNMNSEQMIDYFISKNRLSNINQTALAESLQIATEIFI